MDLGLTLGDPPAPGSSPATAASSASTELALGLALDRGSEHHPLQINLHPDSSDRWQRELNANGSPSAHAGETPRSPPREIDEEESGSRKKLRLSKEQSASLEGSFREHSTLNPKQKMVLARQLNLRPRQIEVWFQNRRARTKLKQAGVDCEYLKHCCETLTEENRRLHREVAELRALKAARPYFQHLPATTLSMCPSCERVAPSSSNANAGACATIVSACANDNPSSANASAAATVNRPSSFAALFSSTPRGLHMANPSPSTSPPPPSI